MLQIAYRGSKTTFFKVAKIFQFYDVKIKIWIGGAPKHPPSFFQLDSWAQNPVLG